MLSSSETGALIGIGVGGAVIVILVILLILFFVKRRRYDRSF
jgi:uncharacterized membrane protein YqiK